YQWQRELAWPTKVAMTLLMAAVTGLAAQVRYPLPNTPVPVTGQVFAVLLSGVLLGGRWGGLSQALYVGLGAAGLGWFAGGSGVIPLGPTWGYLLGFIPAAIFVGWTSDRFVWARRFVPQVGLMLIAVAIIYAFGAAGVWFCTRVGWAQVTQWSVAPFIPYDVGKAILAATLSTAILPKNTAAPLR
ncbi:biotin transporter BioY, partial [Candidatus Sumerlaeota bacterium]|nr:biotin transporter BioY [Candidatus Sumerlaeota bacterium]